MWIFPPLGKPWNPRLPPSINFSVQDSPPDACRFRDASALLGRKFRHHRQIRQTQYLTSFAIASRAVHGCMGGVWGDRMPLTGSTYAHIPPAPYTFMVPPSTRQYTNLIFYQLRLHFGRRHGLRPRFATPIHRGAPFRTRSSAVVLRQIAGAPLAFRPDAASKKNEAQPTLLRAPRQ